MAFTKILTSGLKPPQFSGVAYKIGGQFATKKCLLNSPYAVPWWYRNEFEIPAADKGKQVWMQFRGINYRAEIWINGKKVAGSDEVVGAFRRYDFQCNRIHSPGAKKRRCDFCFSAKGRRARHHLGGLEFRRRRIKDMGYVAGSHPLNRVQLPLRHPFVETKTTMPKAEIAHLTVRTFAKTPVRAGEGNSPRKIEGGGLAIDFAQVVELAASESREIAISPDLFRR